MFKKEPALIMAVLAAIVQAAIIFFTDNPGIGPDWLLPILTILAGWLTRGRVYSENTVQTATSLTKLQSE